MQTIGMAWLTALIPVVLFLFAKENESLFEWDKIVILDRVIEARKLAVSMACVFLPLLFWDPVPIIFKFVLFLPFAFGALYPIKILFSSYRWIKTLEIEGQHDPGSFRSILRNKYLDEIKDPSEIEKLWSLTWHKAIPNTLDERNFVNKFILHMDALAQNDRLDVLARCLVTFSEFVDKRALYDWGLFDNLFKKLLDWRFAVYQKNGARIAHNDTTQQLALHESTETVRQLIKKFVLSALKKRTAYVLFETLKKHTTDKEETYIKKLLSESICRTFFDNIAESDERHDIWEPYFPSEWKITKLTLEDKKNIISKIWHHEFLQWAQGRVWGEDSDNNFDASLNEVSSNLFPSVDPILWAKILTFRLRPWTNDNRMKSLVEQRRNFGFMGRVMVGDTDRFDEQMKSEEKATLELAMLLFKSEFTKEKLRGFISDLKGLTYVDGTKEDSRRKGYISIFERLLSLSGGHELGA